jgi:hypothetical protein
VALDDAMHGLTLRGFFPVDRLRRVDHAACVWGGWGRWGGWAGALVSLIGNSWPSGGSQAQ